MSIQATGITKTFGKDTALAGVDFHAPSGKLVALLGPSGSGKTTLSASSPVSITPIRAVDASSFTARTSPPSAPANAVSASSFNIMRSSAT